MFSYLTKQPDPLERFAYDSAIRKKCTLTSEFVLLNDTIYPEVWIVVDLYSHIDPPLLSPHILRKNSARNEKLIIDLMQMPVPNSSYYKYNLNNCHIRKTGNLRLRNEIIGKLKYLKSWQTEQSLDKNAIDIIENTFDIDYFDIKSEKKVYIGFTAYARNPDNCCKEQISDTVFSNAIYDVCNFSSVMPSSATTTAGGSEHIIKLCDNNAITTSPIIQIKLSDEYNSWNACTMGYLQEDGLHFTAPPYTGQINANDKNCLINLQVMENIPIGAIKFVYIDNN
ncbi:hypothetical protein FF38_07649 [Lucilia cuprina]|uniref:Uncharacterized protein n=1 Tax=Lucilia cuprina TaxID=7375 RepID=A0A0L0CRJ9_LUCCU|nr:hypothetical protein CVS40_5460 [Lucilia cuprina]KNC34861.1 hypothetical protein FF38_07649 [Lucilia cuprina]